MRSSARGLEPLGPLRLEPIVGPSSPATLSPREACGASERVRLNDCRALRRSPSNSPRLRRDTVHSFHLAVAPRATVLPHAASRPTRGCRSARAETKRDQAPSPGRVRARPPWSTPCVKAVSGPTLGRLRRLAEIEAQFGARVAKKARQCASLNARALPSGAFAAQGTRAVPQTLAALRAGGD